MSLPLPSGLGEWHEAPRVRRLNAHGVRTDGRYVLFWLQQVLRRLVLAREGHRRYRPRRTAPMPPVPSDDR